MSLSHLRTDPLLVVGLTLTLNEIKRHYIGYGNLTQASMEGFFSNDLNFHHCIPGFFHTVEKEECSTCSSPRQ